MNGQFNLFTPTTSKDSEGAISSAESQFGTTPSGSQAGPTTAKSGPAPAPVSPSARPAKAKRSTTKGIFGQSGFHSSRHEDLSFALGNRLRPLTDSLGSTLFSLTWMTRITPAGRSISALRASEPLTEGSVFIGWPTPQKHDERERGNTMADCHYFPHDLSNAATMAAWPTTTAEDAESSGMRHARGVADTLTSVASLAGWATPAKNEFEQSDGEALMARRERCMETANNGNGFGLTLGNQVQLAGWKTPCVPNGGRISGNKTGPEGRSYKGETMDLNMQAAAFPNPSMDSGEKLIGYLLGPRGWETVPACGQLSAAHSRWLMGLPPAWDDCGVTAMESLRRRRKSSSGRT